MKTSWLSVAAFLPVCCSAAWAQPAQMPEPLMEQNFEQGLGAWLGLGESAKVSADATPENIKNGTGALRFDYQVVPGQVNLLINPVTPPALATLQSIRFWVKVNHNASLAFTLQEQNGGRFGTLFSVTKDQWQKVEIAPSELVLQTGHDDPEDANGKLDSDRVEAFALVDFGQIFVQGMTDTKNPMAQMLGLETGPRTLYLDDLTLSSRPFPQAPPDKEVIDDFSRPQASWLSVGGVTLTSIKGEQPENNVMEATYTQAKGKLAAFSKLLPAGTLIGKDSLSLGIASKKHVTLIVQLEETSGGKYNAILDLPGDGTSALKTIPLTDFKAANDSKDDNNRLNLESVRQLVLLDASGILGADNGENTLTLQPIRVK